MRDAGIHRRPEDDFLASLDSGDTFNTTLKESEDTSGEFSFKENEDISGKTSQDYKPPSCDNSSYVRISQYRKLIKCSNAINQFSQLVGDTKLEGMSYLSLGCAYYALGDCRKSISCFEQAAKLGKETKDREMEIKAYTNLAVVLEAVGEQKKSHHYIEKALNLSGANEYIDPKQRCEFYSRQGILYHHIDEYEKSIRYHEDSLKLSRIIGYQQGEGTSHYNLGTVYCTCGQYKKSIEHHQKCLEIRTAMGDKHGQGISCTQLTYLYYKLGGYDKSIEYQEKALAISMEIGAREMETASYNNLGCVHQACGHYETSIAFYEKWLYSEHAFVDRKRERRMFRHLSHLFHALGHHERARSCQERAFSVEGDNSLDANEFICSSPSGSLQEDHFESIEVMEGDENERFLIPRAVRSHTARLNVMKTSDFLSESLKIHEKSRLNFNDECKISLDDQSVSLYKTQSLLFASFGNTNASLFAAEQGRARVLVDLISKTYGFQDSSNTAAAGIHSNTISSLVQKQKCSFLFVAFLMKNLALWFIDKEGKLSFKLYSEPDPLIKNTEDLLETLNKEMMSTINTDDGDDTPPNEDVERMREEKRDLCLRRLYKAIIAPIADLIAVPEIIIVPEGQMSLIPFAALRDANGMCLSENLRIRLIPSLTTLKLIQDSPANYHSETEALIVGDPTVGLEEFPPLPAARDEVQMISDLLGIPCLVGEQATKEAVLRNIQEVSLVHIAAIGNVERGEPALALSPSFTGEPNLEDFVLTMQDIAGLKIRAKLVVLSTCYSARGKVMSGEGVVGIARAFLGSGARSVLMSLWPVRDEATRTFMHIFYTYLALDRMSASEALHRAQKDMRSTSKWTGFKDEQDWASFTLLGDDVTLDLRNDTVES